MLWDTLIKNALLFDGRAELPSHQDVAIVNGKVAEVSTRPKPMKWSTPKAVG